MTKRSDSLSDNAAARAPSLAATHHEASIPRLALRIEEAAESLGVSRSTFEQVILPDLHVVQTGRTGRLILVPVASIERWLGNGKDGKAALLPRDDL